MIKFFVDARGNLYYGDMRQGDREATSRESDDEVRRQNAAVTLAKIADLELKITQRRVREALLTGDVSFIADIDAQIATLRATL